uniref:Cytochrome c oxidase subunit n=1 Tax=Cuerna arida TaxID=1464854 RepID=A0A1B6GZV4_9HEMI
MSANGNGNGNGNGKIQFRKSDGVEKDGYICFPLEAPVEEAVEEEVVVEERKPEKFDLSTCPEDPRFQQTNRTKWCYRMYIDYHRCRHLLGDSASQCDYFYKCYNSLCPIAWHERWDEQLQQGTFPRDVTRELPGPKPAPCP